MKYTVTVTTAWWLVPYLNTLLFWGSVSNSQPDYNKLNKIIARGIRVK